MNLLEAMEQRHAIRAYTDEPVDQAILDILRAEIDACNQESGLHIQMAAGLDDAFLGLKTHYGRFTGVHNAIALIGRPVRDGAASKHDAATETATGTAEPGATTDTMPNGAAAAWHKAAAADEAATDLGEIALQERVGYYGERLALRAVQLGLETSWAVLDDADTAEHPWWCLHPGEKIVWVLAFGHGARPGGRRRSKPIEELCRIPDGMAMPDWFRAGMEAAMLAPTSLSQQPFLFTLHEDGTVSAEATEGLFAHVGLGCAKYHFEVGAGRENVRWRDAASAGEGAVNAAD
ncbi:nitroreductase family protein [Bifidobacterium sp. UBA4282]|uniref:nitroreductase family protein n=1 Tax=Bifidobacterium sp. UBA4282 TaxID=1946096 RepID=UPI0025BEC3C0|nr:nitroreductase family protein [Bifidobacterium sp. UBA4282]